MTRSDVSWFSRDLTAIRIGDRVQILRSTKDWSVHDLALRMGVADTVVSDIEDGVRLPSIGLLYRLAKGLQVAPGELLPSEQDRPKIELHLPITDAPDSSTAQIIGGGPGNPTQTYLFEMVAGESDEGYDKHPGEELLIVIEGEIICSTLGLADVTITTGGSHQIVTHLPHGVRVGPAGPARFLLVSTDACDG